MPEPEINGITIEGVMDLAEDAAGSLAPDWMKSHPPVFEGKTPLELCETQEGRERVAIALMRLMHGIYS